MLFGTRFYFLIRFFTRRFVPLDGRTLDGLTVHIHILSRLSFNSAQHDEK